MTHPTKEAIIEWMAEQDGPVLWSQVEDKFGRWAPTHVVFNQLLHDRAVEAVFPEARPGASGRQFWVIAQ